MRKTRRAYPDDIKMKFIQISPLSCKMAELVESLKNLSIEEKTDPIVEKLGEDLEGVMQKWRTSFSANYSGGKMRGDRGEDIESFVQDAIHYIGERTGKKLVAKRGDSDKKELCLVVGDRTIRKKHQVDIHLYVDDVFSCVIECKSYLDSCYYVRACDDFRLFRKFGFPIKTVVFTLENCIDSNTKQFHDHLTDMVCDRVFCLLDGKRSGTKPIFDEKHKKPVNVEKLAEFVDFIVSL